MSQKSKAASDQEEQAFWGSSGPSKPSRVHRESLTIAVGDDSLLLDSKVNLGDYSLLSEEGPLPTMARNKNILTEDSHAKPSSLPLVSSSSSETKLPVGAGISKHIPLTREEEDEEIGSGSTEEETVILQKPPKDLSPPRSPVPPTPPKAGPSSEGRNTPIKTKPAINSQQPITPRQQINAVAATPGTLGGSKVRVTEQTERIVVSLLLRPFLSSHPKPLK